MSGASNGQTTLRMEIFSQPPNYLQSLFSLHFENFPPPLRELFHYLHHISHHIAHVHVNIQTFKINRE